jgi:hypothetical protein
MKTMSKVRKREKWEFQRKAGKTTRARLLPKVGSRIEHRWLRVRGGEEQNFAVTDQGAVEESSKDRIQA